MKINNKKYKDWNWKIKIKEDILVLSLEDREKKWRKQIDHQWLTTHYLPSCAMLSGRGCDEASK
jgi:hypothetical protein